MSKKLVFDKLSYAKMLERGGVEHADVHSQSLAESIAQNMYTKDEVDKMIEASFKRLDESLTKFDERTHEMDKRFSVKMEQIENRIEKAVHESDKRVVSQLTRNVGIMLTLLALVASIVHYIF